MHCNIRIVAVVLSLLAAAPVAAQKPMINRVALPSTPAAPSVTVVASAGPNTLQLYVSSDSLTAAPQQRRRVPQHRAPGVTLMLVGAAGVITGLLIDESIVTVPSAAVGLFGLYLYLR